MFTEEGMVSNLYSYLKQSLHSDIRIRTTHVRGGWHDNEFDAHAAGFQICRYIDKEYEAMHEFSECYRLTRKP